jgi:hypothetical protein
MCVCSGEEHIRSMAPAGNSGKMRETAEFLLSFLFFFTRYYDCIYHHRRRLKIGSQMLVSSCDIFYQNIYSILRLLSFPFSFFFLFLTRKVDHIFPIKQTNLQNRKKKSLLLNSSVVISIWNFNNIS